MLKKVLNWLIDKWLAGFMTATFFFLLKLYIDLPIEQKVDFFHFNWLNSILQTSIVLWKVISLISFVVGMFWLKSWWKKMRENSQSEILSRPENPAFNYKIDTFGIDNAKWTWDYNWDPYKKKFLINEVLPLCPVCSSKMELENYRYDSAICARCRLEGKIYHFHLHQLVDDVSKDIVRRLENGEWKSSMK